MALRNWLCASCTNCAARFLTKVVCASCIVPGGCAQIPFCKLLRANALRKLLCASALCKCSVQVARASCSAQLALRKLRCASCGNALRVLCLHFQVAIFQPERRECAPRTTFALEGFDFPAGAAGAISAYIFQPELQEHAPRTAFVLTSCDCQAGAAAGQGGIKPATAGLRKQARKARDNFQRPFRKQQKRTISAKGSPRLERIRTAPQRERFDTHDLRRGFIRECHIRKKPRDFMFFTRAFFRPAAMRPREPSTPPTRNGRRSARAPTWRLAAQRQKAGPGRASQSKNSGEVGLSWRSRPRGGKPTSSEQGGSEGTLQGGTEQRPPPAAPTRLSRAADGWRRAECPEAHQAILGAPPPARFTSQNDQPLRARPAKLRVPRLLAAPRYRNGCAVHARRGPALVQARGRGGPTVRCAGTLPHGRPKHRAWRRTPGTHRLRNTGA